MFYYSLTSMKTLPVKRRDDKEVWGSEGPSESNFSLFVREGDSPWASRISAYKLMWGWRGDPSNEADAATPVKKGSVMLEQKGAASEPPRPRLGYAPRGAARSTGNLHLAAAMVNEPSSAGAPTTAPRLVSESNSSSSDFVANMYSGNTIRRISTADSMDRSSPSPSRSSPSPSRSSKVDDDGTPSSATERSTPRSATERSTPRGVSFAGVGTGATVELPTSVPDGPVDAAVVRVLLQALAAQQKELLELREGQKRAQRDLDAVKRRLAVSERNVSSVSSALAAVLAQSVES